MYKKYVLVFAIFCTMLFAQNSYSQWTFAGGVAGAGSFPSVSVVDANTVFIFGGPSGNPQVFLSTNGGANFTTLPTAGLGPEFYCGWGVNSTTCFAGNGGANGGAGGNAQVFRTTNGGANWTSVVSTGGSAGFFNGIVFSRSNPNFGIAQSDPTSGVGNPYFVSKTTDGGATWNTTNPPGVSGMASAQNSIVVIDDQFYGFGLGNTAPARCYLTSNGGTSWFVGSSTITGGFVAGLAFHDNKMTGVMSTSNSFPNIARTTNGGLNWTSVSVGGSGTTTLSSLKWIPGTNIVYYIGNDATGTCRKSTDGGATWSPMTTAGLSGLSHFDFYKDGNNIYGYCVASDGSVLKLVDVVTGVEDPVSNVPSEYKLSQNYPNPFNPSTTIEFSIPKASYVTLKVYDALGKEVATIVNNNLQPGTYSQEFTASSNLGSGVYFYQLSAGEFVQTKKLILAK